jgi:hypothetical protein
MNPSRGPGPGCSAAHGPTCPAAKGLVVVAVPLLALDRRARVLRALVANVRADRPPRTRVGLLDRNKAATHALVAQLEAMADTEQRLLAGRQAQARRARALALGAIGLSVLLGVAGGVAAVVLFTAGVTRRAAQLEGNAERLAERLPLLPASPGRDALGALAGGLERAAVLLGEREQPCARPRPCWSTSSPGARW